MGLDMKLVGDEGRYRICSVYNAPGSGGGVARAMRAARVHAAQFPAVHQLKCIMGDWTVSEGDWQPRPYSNPYSCIYGDKQAMPPPPPPPPPKPPRLTPPSPTLNYMLTQPPPPPLQRMENPREIRNKAEKRRRDKLNQSIAELAAMVPPVVASTRKIDKTGVLRLTAHYLRAHQYVFGDTLNHGGEDLKLTTAESILNLLNGFLLTTTYRGIVVVVSQNVHQYLGYKELDLLGQSVFSIVHPGDHRLLREQMTPNYQFLGKNGELLVPDEPDAKKAVEDALTHDQRRFIIRFKKQGQRAEPVQYVTCHIEGSFRKSDRACRGYNRCCQVVRRARARSDNPCSSGNDVVFIGVVRPTMETFLSESRFESLKLEYRTRHSIDGEIIQCEQRISLVTGYMTNEVNGVNAMNFMHKDDVQWVIMTLRDMYVRKKLYGESCYRLMTKNGDFIYMRTRGCLDVDENSRAVTTFVCTNTVVQEQEGKHFIRMMKKNYVMNCKNKEGSPVLPIPPDKNKETSGDDNILIKDPRVLKKEILHLVNDLPSPSSAGVSDDGEPVHSLALIPPRKERIVSAIEKIYTVIKTFPKEAYVERQLPAKVNFDLMNQSTQTEKLTQTPMLKQYPESSSGHMERLITFEDAFMPRNTQAIATISPEIINVEEYEGICAQNRILHPLSYVTPSSTVSLSVNNQALLDGNFQVDSKINYINGSRVAAQPSPAIADVTTNLEGYRNCGLKRSIDSTDCDSILKRKNTQIEENNSLDDISPQLSLESLLDEAILNTEFSTLDTELDSLEKRDDPSFPDLLSNEVQEILGTIEEDPNEDFTSGT